MRLRGKCLLILGGQLKLCDVVFKAKDTIVTDWFEESPVK